MCLLIPAAFIGLLILESDHEASRFVSELDKMHLNGDLKV